jgi:outer membrane receptor protein involved in Fe transport
MARQLKKWFAAGVLGVAVALATSLTFAKDQATYRFDLPAQSLAEALRAIARQTGANVLFESKDVKGIQAAELKGAWTAEEAIAKVLIGTRLEAEKTTPTTVIVQPVGEGRTSRAEDASGQGVRVVQAEDNAGSSGPVALAEEKKVELEEIVVTGTNIRGVRDQFSPVETIDRESIDRAGFNGVADAIAALPQNFGGGATGNLSSTTLSIYGPGTVAANLRGLGPSSTLTLINGRRVAPGGLHGDVVDISTIPVSAIERVEVLTDGASAIYGADAIGGAVNVILRKRYDGAESRARFGSSTAGGGEQIALGQTVGRVWSDARALLSYEYGADDPVDVSDRSVGGVGPTYLVPDSERHSVFASGGINLTPRWNISADGYFTSRHSKSVSTLARTGTTYRENTKPEKYGFTLGTDLDFSDTWHFDSSVSLSHSYAPHFREFRDAVTGSLLQTLTNKSTAETVSAEAKVGGAIFRAFGGDAKLLLGSQGRHESYDGFQADTTGLVGLDVKQGRDIGSLFAELYLPLVGESNAISGVNRLALTAAGRYEHYSNVGSSTNPKVGLLYSPVQALTFRASYGTSFRAPLLEELQDVILDTYLAYYRDPEVPTGRSLALIYFGSTSDLNPEKARNFSAGLDFAPPIVPDLMVRATYFDIHFKNQIVSLNPNIDFSTLEWFDSPVPITRDVTPQQISDVVSRTQLPLNVFVPGATPDQATILIDSRPINAANTRTRGIDLSLSYETDAGRGKLRMALNGTRLLRYARQNSAIEPALSLLNDVGQPLRVRFRAELGFSAAQWDFAGFINHTGAYEDKIAPVGAQGISAWTTCDLAVSYGLNSKEGAGIWAGLSATLAARNVFDSEPPRVLPRGFGQQYSFDPANADPLGRFLSLQVTKKWGSNQ